MNTHIGKIGRLSRDIREQLGERIEEGIPNKELVAWLNETPAVQHVLAMRFEGRAITEQNLSEWKQTGHVEWVRREERRALALQLLEQRDEESMEPQEMAAEKEVSDRLGRELGMEMARLALALVEQDGSTEERWKRLCGVYREVSRLRRDDERGERMRIQQERWELERIGVEANLRTRHLLEERLAPVRVMAETMLAASKVKGRKRTEEPKATKCKRKAKSNDEARMPKEVPETPGANIEQPTFNAQHPRELHVSAVAKAMADSLEGIENTAETEGIQVNPSKSNQTAPTEGETAASQPNLETAETPGGGAEDKAANSEEIQPNPSKSNRYTDEENEKWLKMMNFI